MLSESTSATPRPRPPAKARRSSSSQAVKLSPPPPYVAAANARPSRLRVDTLLGSPIGMTAKMVGWDPESTSMQASPAAEDINWLNVKAREELSGLLMKADETIKERETELDMTSAFCRTLSESNVTLKFRHQALLARIPGSPLHSPVSTISQLAQSPQYFNTSLPRSTTDSLLIPGNQSRPFHTRKISVSHSDIALLSDQNTELMMKIEKLESESSQTDQAGRRVLKRLEKEIQVLREELEKAQVRSEELEEKAKAGFGIGAEKVVEEVWRKKLEREAKLKELRGKPEPSEEAEPEIRDFAPAHPMSSSPTKPSYSSPIKSTNFKFPSTPPPEINLLTKPELSRTLTPDVSSRQSGSPRNQAAQTGSAPQYEYALISQLLLKVRELEEANEVIRRQQSETATKLQAVQRDAASINKAYECLGEQDGVEFIIDEEHSREREMGHASGDTIRFRSLRKSLDGNIALLMRGQGIDLFSDGIEASQQSTVRGVSALNFNATQKMRKSVVGLFDAPQSAYTPQYGEPPISRSVGGGVPFPSPSFEEDRTSSWIATHHRPSSPALSSLSLTTPRSEAPPELSPVEGSRRTLESELGGEDWGLSADNHHLRTSSLYALSEMSVPPSPSPAPGNQMGYLSNSLESGLRTPVSMASSGLQLTLEAPTPERAQDYAEPNSWSSKQTLRYRRMSQTVRSRTNKWVDGRFKDTLLGGKTPAIPEEEAKQAPMPTLHIPQRFASALEVVMESFTGRPATKASGAQPTPKSTIRQVEHQGRERDSSREHCTEVQLHQSGAVGKTGKGEVKGAVGYVVELWLWLQFAIIILVFLWAMAKRGPKTVLGEAERRRAGGSVPGTPMRRRV